MKRALVGLVMFLMALHAHGQGSPEEAAIAEILTAKDLATVEEHLPKALCEALDSTDRTTREQLLSRPRSLMDMKGLKIAQANDTKALVAFDVESQDEEIKHFEMIAKRRISSGTEAVLLITFVAPEKTWGEAEVWMRLEDGEWRITDLTDPEGYDRISLDDPELIAQLVHSAQYENEMTAIGSLRMYVTAIVSYSAAFNEVPQSLEMLGGSEDAEVTSEHARLLDPELARKQARSGYSFSYEEDSIDSYTITASPVNSGKSGTRNFFVDQSGVIRFTSEDRAATASDPPLQDRWSRRYVQ